MTTAIRYPSPALAPFVEAFWYVEDQLPPSRERRLPSGEMQIVVNLAEDELRWYDGPRLDRVRATHGAGLCAALAGPIGIDTSEQLSVLGVAFRPGGTVPFFTDPAAALSDPVVGLDALWGTAGSVLRERLLERPTPAAMLRALETAVRERMRGAARPDRALSFAAAQLDRGHSVGAVTESLGTSASTFTRRFRDGIGLAPKAFARVRRLQRVLGSLPGQAAGSGVGVDWAEQAARHGFCDQSHLIHDFRDLTGLTPAAYEPRTPGAPNHVLL